MCVCPFSWGTWLERGVVVLGFLGNCLPTTIGSLPHTDARESTQLMLRYTPQIPAWVQMPKLPKEDMLTQFIEGIPGLVWQGGSPHFLNEGQEFEEEVLAFYEDYLSATEKASLTNLEKRFAISPDYASGLYALIDALNAHSPLPFAIKGQITGPFTLGTSLTDKAKRYAYYDPTLKDIIVKSLAMKAKWQVKKFKSFGVPVIISIDEPLAGYGSSTFISVSKEDIQESLGEIIGVIHKEEGIVATHCCENTDWALLLNTEIDILSFDAYGFFDKLLIYEKELKEFIERGGIIAWGIVPTHDPNVLSRETGGSLVSKWKHSIQKLMAKGIEFDRLFRQSLITPSCGAGSLSPELAEKVLAITREVSDKIRNEYL